MSAIRRHLSYANVVSTIGIFLLLAGGTAVAAKQLGKKTVGTKQLKGNAVTKAKIKKNAVTRAKIRNGSVNAAKLADGAVTNGKIADSAVSGAKIDTASTVFGRRVARLASNATVPIAGATVYPVGSYTQNADEDNQLVAAYDLRFGAGCTPPRVASAYLLIDAPDPLFPQPGELLGYSIGEDKTAGEATRRFDFKMPFVAPGSDSRTASSVASSHKLDVLVVGAGCTAGSGIDVVGALVDVIGTR